MRTVNCLISARKHLLIIIIIRWCGPRLLLLLYYCRAPELQPINSYACQALCSCSVPRIMINTTSTNGITSSSYKIEHVREPRWPCQTTSRRWFAEAVKEHMHCCCCCWHCCCCVAVSSAACSCNLTLTSKIYTAAVTYSEGQAGEGWVLREKTDIQRGPRIEAQSIAGPCLCQRVGESNACGVQEKLLLPDVATKIQETIKRCRISVIFCRMRFRDMGVKCSYL